MLKKNKDKMDQIDLKLWQSFNNVPSIYKLTEKTKKYIKYKDWYTKSNKFIKEMFKDDSNLFIDILAVTSIRTTVKQNTINALDCYYRVKKHKPLNKKYGMADKSIKINLKRILKGNKIHGNKISNFAKCLKGNLDNIVIDVWVMRCFNINRNSPTNKDIKYIEYMIKQIAKNLNIKNAEVQACLWVYAKRELNKTSFKKDKDFSYYLKQYNRNTLDNLKYKQLTLNL